MFHVVVGLNWNLPMSLRSTNINYVSLHQSIAEQEFTIVMVYIAFSVLEQSQRNQQRNPIDLSPSKFKVRL